MKIPHSVEDQATWDTPLDRDVQRLVVGIGNPVAPCNNPSLGIALGLIEPVPSPNNGASPIKPSDLRHHSSRSPVDVTACTFLYSWYSVIAPLTRHRK